MWGAIVMVTGNVSQALVDLNNRFFAISFVQQKGFIIQTRDEVVGIKKCIK